VDLCGPLPLFLFQCGGTMGEKRGFRVNDPVFSRRSATEPFTVEFPFFFAIPVCGKLRSRAIPNSRKNFLY
jgi:hypothetical protein